MGAAAQNAQMANAMPMPGQNGFGPVPVPRMQPPPPGQVPMNVGPASLPGVPLPSSDQAASMRKQMALDKLKQMLTQAGQQGQQPPLPPGLMGGQNGTP